MKPLLQQAREHIDFTAPLASKEERADRERVFMSGAAAMFFASLELTQLSDDAAEARVEAYDNELRDYFHMLSQMPRRTGLS